MEGGFFDYGRIKGRGYYDRKGREDSSRWGHTIARDDQIRAGQGIGLGEERNNPDRGYRRVSERDYLYNDFGSQAHGYQDERTSRSWEDQERIRRHSGSFDYSDRQDLINDWGHRHVPERFSRDDSSRLIEGSRSSEMSQRYGSHQKAGQYSGRGPKGYQRSDNRIKEDVCERLTRDPHIDASDIEVQVSQGEVSLSGFVTDRSEKRHAEDLIEGLPGVKEVHNKIRVQRPQDRVHDNFRDPLNTQQQHGRSDPI